MRSFLSSIHPQVVIAYGVLAAVILAIVAGAVIGSSRYIEANTIPIGDLRAGSFSVDRAGALAVDAEITLGYDEMTLSGGADQLLELEFVTNVAEDPGVTYQVDSGLGDLRVEPSVPSGIPDPRRLSEYRNEWDLRLNDATPMDLNINLGTGVGNIDLRGLTLTGLTIELGTGEATVDLRGDWVRGLDAEIEGGIGEFTLLLPSETGVRVTVDQGIGQPNLSGLELVDGAYVNPAYGSSDVTLNVTVEQGIGELNLEVRDEEEAR